MRVEILANNVAGTQGSFILRGYTRACVHAPRTGVSRELGCNGIAVHELLKFPCFAVLNQHFDVDPVYVIEIRAQIWIP